MLERLFSFRENGTTLARDTVAGFTTFFVMSYVIFVNPAILSFADDPAGQGKGLPYAAALTSTCLVAGVMTLVMALFSNRAYALAPGMGVNAAVAYQLVMGQGLTMANAMGLVVLEGLVIVLLVLTGVRQAVFHVVPAQLKQAIVVGIGFFILFLGLVNGGIVVKGQGTPLALGDFTSVPVYLTLFGLVVMIVLLARGWRLAVPLGIVATTVLAILVNWATSGDLVREGFATIPSSPIALPDFSLVGAFDFGAFAKLGVLGACIWVFSLMLSDFFDSFGTLTGVGGQAGYTTRDGQLPGLKRLLLIDAVAAAAGGAVSSSSATAYIESGAGVAAGGRTGWVGVVVGACFLLAMVFSPVAGMVPAEATAPALVIVGYLMIRTLSEREKLDLRDLSFGLPATLTITLMPLTYSIATGIGAGFLGHVAVRLAKGEWRKVPPLLYAFAVVFLFYFLAPLLREWLKV